MKLTKEHILEHFGYDRLTGRLWRRQFKRRGRKHGTRRYGYMCPRGYRHHTVPRFKHVNEHQLVWIIERGVLPPKPLVIDHINRVRTDNRICNLREVSIAANAWNSKRRERLCGVYKAQSKWRAFFKPNYPKAHLGLFDDWFEAVCCRKSAEAKREKELW